MSTKVVDRIFTGIEIFLGVLFVQGGVNTFFANPLNNPSPFLDALAGQFAIYIYAIYFTLLGLVLLYSMWRRKKKTKAWTLQVMGLTCVYVLILSAVLLGISWGMIPNVIVCIVSFVCYFHWKFKTAYVDPHQFYVQTSQLREDLPPNGKS